MLGVGVFLDKLSLFSAKTAIQTWQNRGYVYNDAFQVSLRCFPRVLQRLCNRVRDACLGGITGILTTLRKHLNDLWKAAQRPVEGGSTTRGKQLNDPWKAS